MAATAPAAAVKSGAVLTGARESTSVISSRRAVIGGAATSADAALAAAAATATARTASAFAASLLMPLLWSAAATDVGLDIADAGSSLAGWATRHTVAPRPKTNAKASATVTTALPGRPLSAPAPAPCGRPSASSARRIESAAGPAAGLARRVNEGRPESLASGDGGGRVNEPLLKNVDSRAETLFVPPARSGLRAELWALRRPCG